MKRNVVAIVNPVAGRGQGDRLRETALVELERLFPGIETHTTRSPDHATEIARELRNLDLVVAVGGDGTVREVANGLTGAAACLAIIPTGSGNDFNRTIGIPVDVHEACRVAATGATREIDFVRVLAQTADGTRESGFANAAGFGFDALVVAETRKSRRLRGLALYGSAVFRAVRDYDCPRVVIRTTENEWEQRILLLAAANGRFYGGGMAIAPDARPDDGQLDICVIDEVGRLKVIRYLPSLVRGTHGGIDEVTFYRSPTLELRFADPVSFQLDGDLPDWGDVRTFRLEVLPRTLKVRVPTRPTASAG